MADTVPIQGKPSQKKPKRASSQKSVKLFLYEPDELESEFERNAAQWKEDTRFMSSLTDIVIHPSYQRIMGMGRQALPLIFHELDDKPNHWFWALNAITGEDAAKSETTFEGAVKAWLKWGKERGYIA